MIGLVRLIARNRLALVGLVVLVALVLLSLITRCCRWPILT